MKLLYNLSIVCIFLLTACSSEPSLQKYFVENTENKNFISMDIAPSILDFDKTKLSAQQKEALEAFDKMNVLAFKLNDQNKAEFEVERNKVNLILKSKKYQQLMKVGSGSQGVTVSYVGSDSNIEEFIFFGTKKEAGFAIIRVLGKDMNPSNIMNLIALIGSSDLKTEQLKPLLDLIKR